MRISSKCRYGIAAMILLAENENNNEYITILHISEKLGVSKIYLEQVFSLLKRAELVKSVKGAKGGYKLFMPSENINAGMIIRAIETGLFEKTKKTLSEKASYIDETMSEEIWDRIDDGIAGSIDSVKLSDILEKSLEKKKENSHMFYI